MPPSDTTREFIDTCDSFLHATARSEHSRLKSSPAAYSHGLEEFALATLVSKCRTAAIALALGCLWTWIAAPSTADTNDRLKADEMIETGREPSGPDETNLAPSATPGSGVEEILIRGERMQKEVEETVSGVDFDPAELRAEGITDIRDLSSYTPNLEIKTAFAASNPTLFIRGVGLDDFNANSASAVAVYQDGTYMNSPAGQLFQFFDVEGIQVLRGPQGTLRNASAGAILVTSRRPTEDFEAFLSTSYGRFNQVDFQGALNIPIIPETLSWRGSFVVNRRDGFVDNRCQKLIQNPDPPDQSPCQQAVGQDLKQWVNNTYNWAGRSLLRAQLPLGGWDTDWTLNLHGARNDSDSIQYQHRGWKGIPGTGGMLQPGKDEYNYEDPDGDPYAGDYDVEGPEILSLLGGSLTVVAENGDGIEIKSITSYEWHDRYSFENTDAGPRRWLETVFTDKAWQVSQESQASLLFGDTGEVTVGGNFLMEDLSSENLYSNLKGVTTSFDQKFTQQTRAFALFGEVSWQPTSQSGSTAFMNNLVFEAGARFNWESKDFNISSVLLVTGGSSNISKAPTGQRDSWTGWSGYGSVTYEFDSENSAYLKYSRGWKPGQFNGGTLFSTELVVPVKPETVDSFELGFKTLWLENRLGINLTGFIYDYQDLQVFLLKQDPRGFLLPSLVNSEKADVKGAELEIYANPAEGLELRFAGAWLDSAYTDFSVSFDRLEKGSRPPRTETITADFSGKRLIASPVWSFTSMIEYAIPLDSHGTLLPRFSYSWKDDVFFGPNEGAGQEGRLPGGALGQGALGLMNAALTWESADERFTLTGWVRNIQNVPYRVQSFDLTNPYRLTIDVYGDPRTYGFTAILYFY